LQKLVADGAVVVSASRAAGERYALVKSATAA